MDINISSQIVVQTSAQWAADNTVYSAKRILVTSDAYYRGTSATPDQRKFKIADGVNTWSNLDYMPIAQSFRAPTNNDSSVNIEDTFAGVQFAGANYYGEVYVSDTELDLAHEQRVHIDTPTILITQSTASRIMATDANKNIQYLNTATYPSLTELAYLKGATSNIQTQLNAVAPLTVNSLGAVVDGASSATPNDTDLVMSVDTSVAKKNTWTQIKAFLKTYFDTVYKATFTENTAFNKNFGTGTTNIVEIGSTLGNSLITSTDANGKLQTLTTATYPSLTELSYVKGLTSAVQTQLGTKPIQTKSCGALQNHAPADNTTLYFGSITSNAINSLSTNRQFYLKTGTLRVANITFYINTNQGSNENVTINLRNITDATSSLIGTITMDVLCSSKLITGLSITTDSSKLYSVEVVFPAFATNPTNCQYTVELEIY